MDRLKSFLQSKKVDEQEYEPLNENPESHEGTSSSHQHHQHHHHAPDDVPFSWVEYGIFTLLGVAMLWAWCEKSPSFV